MAEPTVQDLALSLELADPEKFTGFFDYQLEAFDHVRAQTGPKRLCLYYRTGAGKSITSLCAIALSGYTEAVVVAPPVTHPEWEALGRTVGVKVTAVSHSKFRMKDFVLSRHVPVIADEFHMFGGVKGQGWKKLDRLAGGLTAPLILASATPNYNDAERVYCIQHVLDPHSVKGGYLAFLYAHCTTEQNNFGMTPLVTGFQRFKDAEHYLSSLPHVVHVPDNVKAVIHDVVLTTPLPDEFERYGLDRRKGRIMASQMEERHTRMFNQLVDEGGLIHSHVYDELTTLVGYACTPVLMFCNSARIAQVLAGTCKAHGANVAVVTGADTTAAKQRLVSEFRGGAYDVLIGTATLATGTDGLDKMCDMLVIVNDTDDDALRRQLVGRIMPRGADADASGKQVYRLVIDS